MIVRNSITKHLNEMKDKDFYPGVVVKSNIPKVKEYVPDAKCIFEIGANDGVDVIQIHEIWPDAEIHIFEIDTHHFPRLKRFISEYIHVNFFGLYNYDGKVEFNRLFEAGKNFDDFDFWRKTASGIKKMAGKHTTVLGHDLVEKVTLDVKTVDTYCREFNYKPDILMLDTQGSEYEILEGAKETLKNVNGIILEWSSDELYEGMKQLSEIEKLLNSHGFVMKEKLDLWGDWHGDAIFIRENI